MGRRWPARRSGRRRVTDPCVAQCRPGDHGRSLADGPPVGVVVDLTEVSFLASVGMSVLIEASRRVADVSRFAVIAEGPATGRPLTMMGLGETFAIYTDLDAAVAALSGE